MNALESFGKLKKVKDKEYKFISNIDEFEEEIKKAV